MHNPSKRDGNKTRREEQPPRQPSDHNNWKLRRPSLPSSMWITVPFPVDRYVHFDWLEKLHPRRPRRRVTGLRRQRLPLRAPASPYLRIQLALVFYYRGKRLWRRTLGVTCEGGPRGLCIQA